MELVFVAELLDQRFSKISYAARKLGCFTKIYYKTTAGGQNLQRFFSETVKITFSPEILRELIEKESSKKIILSWGLLDDYAIELFKSKKIIVVEQKDVLPGHVRGITAEWDEKWKNDMNFIYNNTDYFICRDFQLSSYRSGVRDYRKLNRLFLLDYCWSVDLLPDGIAPGDQSAKKRNSIVNIGNFTIERQKPFSAANGLFFLISYLVHLGFIFHHYPFSNSNIDLTDYLELAQKNPGAYYMHSPQDPIQLIHSIQRYHFGISTNQGYHFPQLRLPSRYSQAYVRNSIPARIFDYLSAGVPVLISREHRIARYIKRLGVGIDIGPDLNSLQEILDENKYKKIRERVHGVRAKELNIDSHIEKLLEFLS
jgi:hypothetical protein